MCTEVEGIEMVFATSVRLSPARKLRIFHDLACGKMIVGHREIHDPAAPCAIAKARGWMDRELRFLGNADRFDLEAAWECYVEDGRHWYLFKETIDLLAQKYEEVASCSLKH